MCTTNAFDGKISAEKRANTPEKAIDLAIAELKMKADRIGYDWKKQIQTYMKASVKASSSIMAANETRAKHKQWVRTKAEAEALTVSHAFVSRFVAKKVERVTCTRTKSLWMSF